MSMSKNVYRFFENDNSTITIFSLPTFEYFDMSMSKNEKILKTKLNTLDIF